MTRFSALTLLICLSAVAVQAQERPESAPRPEEAAIVAAPDDSRPPERPEAEETAEPAEDADTPPADDAAQEPEAEAEAELPPEEEAFGPPPPPKWYTLRETDQDYAACKLALSYLGTVYTEEPALTDPENPECGIARPIRVDRILPDLTLEGGAVMRCDTARALGFWSRDFVRPAAALMPDAPRVTAMQLGTTYDCRGRIGTGDAQPKLSEHAYGNAIDIAAFVFDQGDPVPIQPREDTGDTAESFQRAVRGSACLLFTTVLGPGSNTAHEDHLHLDVAARNSDWRLCQ